jgi:hypothetical protein
MVKKIKEEEFTQIRLSKKNRDLINIVKERFNKELANPKGELWDQNDAVAELIRKIDELRPDGEKFNELYAAKDLDVKEITVEDTPEYNSTLSEVVRTSTVINTNENLRKSGDESKE